MLEQFRTCPHYFARTPFVISVIEDLEDYRRAALGNVQDLPAAQLDYLRVADGESSSMQHSIGEDIE